MDDVHSHRGLKGAVIFSPFVQAAAVAPKCTAFDEYLQLDDSQVFRVSAFLARQ